MRPPVKTARFEARLLAVLVALTLILSAANVFLSSRHRVAVSVTHAGPPQA